MKMYKHIIPEIYWSSITTACKARLRLGCVYFSPVALAADKEGNLLIFHQNKLVRNAKLPFIDCTDILVHLSDKEFAIAFSSYAKHACVVDIQSNSVVKEWINVKRIEVKDNRNLGYPQVLVHLSRSLDPIEVSHESDWEPSEKICDDLLSSSNENPSAYKSVVQALEVQLKSVHSSQLVIEKQIALRKSQMNRSLTALRDTNGAMNSDAGETLSYFTRWNQPIDSMLEKMDDLAAVSVSKSIKEFVLATSEVWKYLINDHWVIGTTFTNTSSSALRNVQCVLSTSNENVNYKLQYFQFDPDLVVMTDESVNGFSSFLATNTKYDGKLEQNHSLTVVASTCIPGFSVNETEVANLLMTCSVPERPDAITVQINLGSALLKFQDLNQCFEFQPSTLEMSSLRRWILGLNSILDSGVNAVLSTTFSSASDNFVRASKQLQLQFLAPMQCYYGSGLYGRVCITVQDESPNRLHIHVKTQSDKKMQWFIRYLQSALGDDSALSISSKEAKKVVHSPAQRMATSLVLLSSVETQQPVDDEPLEIETSPIDSPLENFRREFLKKQAKVIDLSEGRGGILNIPFNKYQEWQANCFL